MNTINDGGPAFPKDNMDWGHQGMTLRDWFAGQALAGYIAMGTHALSIMLGQGGGGNLTEEILQNMVDPQKLAESSYGVADAMLAERSKGNAQPPTS